MLSTTRGCAIEEEISYENDYVADINLTVAVNIGAIGAAGRGQPFSVNKITQKNYVADIYLAVAVIISLYITLELVSNHACRRAGSAGGIGGSCGDIIKRIGHEI